MDLNTSVTEISAASGQPQTGDYQASNNDARARTNQLDQQTQNQQQQNQQQPQQQPQNQKPPYTIPGILHYLQYEWHRFEVERQEWEVEKAELSARIALLQGEKKSHKNIRHDLIRRIKMLEYCLRMERAKYHRLTHGTDPPPLEGLSSSTSSDQHQQEDEEKSADSQNKAALHSQSDDGFLSNNSSTITYGRELLKHYLQEIGYTDTIIDLRSNRVRSLLGIVDNNQSGSDQQPGSQGQISNNAASNSSGINTIPSNTSSSIDKLLGSNSERVAKLTITPNRIDNQDYMTTNSCLTKKSPFATKLSSNPGAPTSATTSTTGRDRVGDAESSVLAKFGFLYDEEGVFLKETSAPNFDDMNADDDDDDDDDGIPDEVIYAADRAASTAAEYSYFDKEREVAAMFKQKLDISNDGNITSGSSDAGPTEINTRRDNLNRNGSPTKTAGNPSNAKNWCPQPQKNDVVDIGELASLTILGSETNGEDSRKKQWTNKYRLQSHFDCVRDLKFTEKDSLIVTASEDETIKLWHLTRPTSNSGKSRQPNLPPSISAINTLEASILDIEPLYTYRGHNSRVLTLTVFADHIFSGAQDGEIIMWKLIQDPSSADLYAKFDDSLLVYRFTEHTDSVWSLDIIEGPKSEPLLCSASSDLTIKVWNISGQNKQALLSIQLDSSPTCIIKIPPYNPCKSGIDLAGAFCDGKIRLYNIAASLASDKAQESANTQPVTVLECDETHRINSIVIHPTLPYLASADCNRSIKIWDLKSSKCKSTMVAHLDEVTSLACDPTGKYLLSASHDCSARLWLFEERACIQEMTSHRKKFDEGIFAVAFHPNLSQFATAGADGLAKVFM